MTSFFVSSDIILPFLSGVTTYFLEPGDNHKNKSFTTASFLFGDDGRALRNFLSTFPLCCLDLNGNFITGIGFLEFR